MKTLSDEALKQICKLFTYFYQTEKSCIFKENKLYIHDSFDNTETLVATLESGQGVDGKPLWFGFTTTTGVKFLWDFVQECVIPVLDFEGLCFSRPAQYGLVIHNGKNADSRFNVGDKIKMWESNYHGVVTAVDDKYFYVDGYGIAPKIPISESYEFYKLEE